MAIRPRVARFAAALVTGGAVLAGTLVAPSTAGAATPQNENYVGALYLDLLEREDPIGDPVGVTFWANRLEQPGQTRQSVATGIQRSSKEYYGKVVDLAYLLYLQRSADTAGRDFYIDGWRTRRLTLDAVVVALGGSDEYFRKAGGTNAAFIDRIYFDVFGREVDAGGRAYGLSVIARSSRGNYVRFLVRSTEKRRIMVSDQYGTFLGRIPSPPERDYWVNRLQRGLRSEDFDTALLSSSEYYNANDD